MKKFLPSVDRRQFLGAAGASAASIAMPCSLMPRLQAAQKDDPVRLGFIGLGGRGQQMLQGFLERPDVKVVGLCEVHQHRLKQSADIVHQATGQEVLLTDDLRKLLAERSIDAVVIAAPDHWHAPATVLACRAGKHVYVEKPISNCIWEGQQAVKAARHYDRVVQSGMQNRSAPYNFKARDYIESGKLGDVVLCRVHNQKLFESFDMAADCDPPPELNWDLWNGPCPRVQYNPTKSGYWHQFWDYGGGDVTNDGVHQIDLACMVLGIETLPKSVHSVGYRRGNMAAETPDTIETTFEFEQLPMTFTQTQETDHMIKSDPEVRNGELYPLWQHNGERIEIHGTKGLMMLCRHGGGWQVYSRPQKRQPVIVAQEHGRLPDPENKEDFLDAIRTDRLPNSDIAHGHRSATLCHLANISYRVGNKFLAIDPQAEEVTNCPEASQLFKADYREPFMIATIG